MRFGCAICSLFFALSSASLAQTYDTVSIYFHTDSDRPIVNVTSEYRQYEPSAEGKSTVIKLAAHCDTTGSMEHNDDLAQRRINAVQKQLIQDRWNVNAIHTIYSERIANTAQNYTHELFRRVDIYIKIEPFSNAELLTIQLNQFKTDTVQQKSIDLNIVFFGGTTVLMQEAIPEAKALRDFMLANPNVSVDIHGHVCCGDNYPLSLNRAKMIMEFLMAQGIEAKRMTYQGHSNKAPKVSPERTDDDRKQNRRVAVVFKKSIN